MEFCFCLVFWWIRSDSEASNNNKNPYRQSLLVERACSQQFSAVLSSSWVTKSSLLIPSLDFSKKTFSINKIQNFSFFVLTNSIWTIWIIFLTREVAMHFTNEWRLVTKFDHKIYPKPFDKPGELSPVKWLVCTYKFYSTKKLWPNLKAKHTALIPAI